MTDRLSLLVVCHSLVGGGAQRAVTILLESLDRRRFQPTLALFERRGALLAAIPPDVPIVDLRGGRRLLLGWGALRLALAIRKMRPALVLAVMRIPCLAAAACGELFPDTSVVLWAQGHVERALDERGRPYRALVSPLVRRLYPRARAIIAVSRGVRDNLVQAFGVRAERVQVIPNTLQIEQVRTLAAQEPSLRLDWKVPTVVAVGRLVPQKGFAYLLDAFARLGPRPCQLLILGDGPERAALWRQAQTLGIRDRVVLAGFQPNPFAAMARSAVFVLSSLWEGFPFVLMEAMACGVPVISTDCPSGPAELVTDGENGLLVPPADPAALARAMDRLLADPTRARTMAQAALEGLDAYRSERVIPRYEDALRAIARSR